MFDSEIDVAAIMREIKANIIPEDCEEDNDDEVQRITKFICNTRNNSEEHSNIGYILPQISRYPSVIKKIIILLLQIVRKLSSFIINDQIIVNQNTNACIKALVEREDAIVREKEILLENKLNALSERIELLEEQEKKGYPIIDEMYLEFEKKFRGTEQDISKRQEYYVSKYLKNRNFDSNDIAIDLGCGRGEWLTRINELGLHAIGIDTNTKMIDECRKKGLDAEVGDAISYIRGLDDNSVSIISAFQLIEHIEKNKVIILVKEAYRILKPQGILILETPNICNIEVGACAFHLDPTHINPVHPAYLQFLAQYTGFETAEIVYWKEDSIEEWLLSVMQQDEKTVLESSLFRTVFESVKRLIYSSPDYALVTVK